MGSHAIKWLVKQYQYVLRRMRLAAYCESHPLLAASLGGVAARTVPDAGPRLKVERLEDRVMLSAAPAERATGPLFFLATAGAENVDYHGPVTVDDVDVAPFAAPGGLAGREAEVLEALVAALDTAFPDGRAVFTTDRPADGIDFSTIYLGGDNSAFAEWGDYYGLAQHVDVGNQDPADIAFVFTAEIPSDGLTGDQYVLRLADVVAHEAGHLLGAAHAGEHGHQRGDGGPLAGVAFDPKVHVAIGDDVLADVLDDDQVHIEGADYAVHPAIVAALRNHRSYYNAGVVGPDGFPDSVMGQFVVHAESNATWVTRVLDMAWQAQSDASFNPTERSQILAFAYGYLTHSTSDHWAHTLVNDFAEGVAPGFIAAAASAPFDKRDLGNQLRHLMTEAYMADALQGVDTNPDRTVLTGGDVSDDSTPGISYDAPIRFIYEALIRPFPDDPTHLVELDWDGGVLQAVGGGVNTFVRAAASVSGGVSGLIGDDIKVGHILTVTGFDEPANNGNFRVTAVFPDGLIGNVLATTITVDRALVTETADGDEKLIVHLPKTPLTTLSVDAAAGTITRGTGSFVDEGFIPGLRFSAFGFGANFDNLIVKSVTPTVLTVVGKLKPGDEIGNGDERLVVQGDRGPILNTFFRIRDKLYTKAVERDPTGAVRNTDFGTRVGTLLDRIVKGESLGDVVNDDLLTSYLYNWADAIDDGVRHWGVLGQAITRALFDPQSRRDVQNKVGAEFGADTLANTVRGDKENAVGFLDTLIAELDDPDGDGSTADSFLNNHLLAMAGLPPQLGVLRTAIQSFASVIDGILAGEVADAPVNPTQADADDVKDRKDGFIKRLFTKRFGIDFDTFQVVRKMHAKMDVKSIEIAGDVIPLFKSNDHERLDALMGMPADHHVSTPPAPIDKVVFHPDAKDVLTDEAHFDKEAFKAYKNSVTLTKMSLLMETPPDLATNPLAAPAVGQISAFYADLSGVPTYDAKLLNLHGEHGGNVVTLTLPGAGSKPWLESIDGDKLWRTDSHSAMTLPFRVSKQKTSDSPVEWSATVAPGTYKVYATWLGNVTQDFDNLDNASFPDQKLTPASNARYTVLDDASPFNPPVPLDQRQFAAGVEHEGRAYTLVGDAYNITSTTLRVRLSNVADGHVVAGPILVEHVSDGTRFVIQNVRDPETLGPGTQPAGHAYSDSGTTWTDLAYPTGTGNHALWESALLRPKFDDLFTDWQNGPLQFPALGDTASPDPNGPGGPIPKTERDSHATPFGPPFPDTTLRIPITDAVKDAILKALNALKTIEESAPFDVAIPGLDKSLAQILGISENVSKPIVDYFKADATPTFGELFDVIKSTVGGRIDTLSPVLEFDIDLRKMFSVENLKLALGQEANDVGLNLDATLSASAAVRFLDEVNAALPKLTIGIDLTPQPATPMSLDERVYVKAGVATLSADVQATGLNFGARFGFLGVGVVGGSIDLDADITLTFLDPNSDGKLTLAEITTAPLSSLVDIVAVGTLTGTLPIQVQAGLAGLGAATIGTVRFGATDLFDAGTYDVEFDGNFGRAFSFNNIDAASLTGLLGQLTFWLDEFRRSDEFAQFDVPLVGPALDKVLGVADAFRDKLLVDDADNGVDDAKTLLFDVNAALVAAGLGDGLRAEATADGKLKLIANDANITKLEVAAAAGLGFTADQTASGPDVFESVTAQAPAPADGKIAGPDDVVLSVKVNDGAAVAVTVKKSDTDGNDRIGDDRWKLVNGQNAPTFSTVQEMVLKLTEVFGSSSLQYFPDDVPNTPLNEKETLTFSLNLVETFGQLDLPLGFSLDELPAFLKLQTGGDLRVTAGGDLNLTLGVFLGAAEASTKLNPDGSDPLASLNGGIVIPTAERINGAAEVRTVYGRLSDDANFTLSVAGDPAITDPIDVTVTEASTALNHTAADLAADLGAALDAAGLAGKIHAVAVGNRVELVKAAGAALTGFSLTAATNDPVVKDVGFSPSQAAALDAADGNVKLRATKDLAALRGRLTGDASFDLKLTGVNGGNPFTITVAALDTVNNRYAFDIVNDINAKLIPVTGADADGNPNLIDVGFSGGRLTFTTKGGATGLALTNPNAEAAAGLGLAAAAGDKTDLVITTRAGDTYDVFLDGAQTLQDVIDRIDAQTNGKVTASLNVPRLTGLTLTDDDFAAGGPGTFRVRTANNSTAAMDLGILAADAPEGEAGDGVIEGTDIAGLTPLDRFFVQTTPTGEWLADLGVDITTPTPLTAEASVGFVGLSLSGGGALPGNKALEANLRLRLNQPAGSTDGRVSLAELINSLDDIGSLIDISLTGQADVQFDIAADPILAGLGINVNGAKVGVSVEPFDAFADPAVLPVVKFDLPDNLLDFGNVEFNFQSIIAGLRQLTGFLEGFESFGFLSEPLPIINASVSDLVSVADRFATAVDEARANPAGSLQALEGKLKQGFGLPPDSTLIDLTIVSDDNGTAGDPDDDVRLLRVDLHVDAAFAKTLNLDLDLAKLLGLPDALSLGGSADLAASGGIALDLDFGFDIADPTQVFVFGGTAPGDTGITADVLVAGNDLSFRAALGPLGMFVRGADANITAGVDVGIAPSALTRGRVALGELFGGDGGLLDSFTLTPSGSASATLPVFFPTDSNLASTIVLAVPDLLDLDSVTVSGVDELLAIELPDFSLLDQLLLGVDGFDLFLEGLQDILDGQIGGFELPLIGDKLAGAVDVLGDFREGFVERFRGAIEQLANPGAAFAAAGFGGNVASAAAAAAAGSDPVSDILFQLLGPAGLKLLLDTNNSGAPDVGDIRLVTNINDPATAPADLSFDWDFKLGGPVLDASAGIDFDLGIPGLGLETAGDVNLTIDWELALGFGLNYLDGFYFDIADDSELELKVDVTVPGIGITGKLGFLQITAVEDVDPTEPDPVTHLGATFVVDIKNKDDKPAENGQPARVDGKLGFSELGRVAVDAKVAADAVADLTMRLSLGSDLVPGAPTNFPSVVADFLLDWRLGTRTADGVGNVYVPLADLGGSFLEDGLQFVGFTHVGLDLGTYFTNLIGPIVEKVQEVTEPIKPFLDFLTEPIPVISDLAGPTSLLDIAAMSGAVNPGIIKAIEVVDQVIDIADRIDASAPNAIMYFDGWLPSLVIFDASAPGAFAAGELPDLTDPNLDLDQLADGLLGGLGKFLPADIAEALGDVATDLADGLTEMLPGGKASGGFRLDIIEDPSQVFGMLMGQPADLVTFTMDALSVEAEFSAFFSIFGPLGVSINAEFAAQFGPFKFGYDTTGIQNFAAGDFKNPLLLFDGLYVSDLDVDLAGGPGNGNDVPEIQFDAGLWAAAELNLGIARGGVGGGLFAEIDFDLHDPNDDGRVRVTEIVTNVLNEFNFGNPVLSPLAMFDISGKLTAELFAFLKIDFGFFELDKKFLLTEPITLLDFESDFDRYPTLATELPGGVLQLNMGKFADQRVEGDKTDGDEEFHVKQGGGDGSVLVWGLGVDEADAQEYDVSSRIIALGGEGDDVIDLSGVTADIELELEGNAGDDVITAGGGAGAARILGGPGDDTLTGGGGDDTIFGEVGDDVIDGAAGRDWLFGDGEADGSVNEERDNAQADPPLVGYTLTAEVKGNDGADAIGGGDGEDVIFGGGGRDTLGGGADADVLVGDAGQAAVGLDRLVKAVDPGRLELAVRDTSRGSQGDDDTLGGDGGGDHLFGGVGDDALHGGADADVIYGEAGLDTIHGDGGNDIAFGDFGTFAVANNVLGPVATAGGEADQIFGDDDDDRLLGGAGDDAIEGGIGDDSAWGGTGLDTIHGNGGADHLYGNADPDRLFGDAGGDFLEGGHGDDLAEGGDDNDLLVGGYGSDTLDGQSGGDTYQITARGGSATEQTTAYDSGPAGETDGMILVGTPGADTVLLRAMADYYFPTKTKLIGDAVGEGLTDRIFDSGEPDKLAAILQALEDAYGPHDVPAGLVGELIDLYGGAVQSSVLSALGAQYVPPPPAGSTVPTLATLQARVIEIFDSESRGKLAEIQAAVTAEYGDNPVPPTMLDAIANAFQAPDSVRAAMESAIDAKYQDEQTVLGSTTDTGFVALINNGGANVERFNYRQLESLSVNTLQGDDYVVSDDAVAATTVNLGAGEDRFQSGQVFRSERVKDPAGELITGITAADVFTTLEITRGWLSNGISRPATVNGGDGNDQFTVFRNVAVLNLNGGDGDDVFTVRAFALKGSSDNERARTDMKGDGGADTILYVVNAPVGIDGGDGFDTVRVVGTEFGDDFVVTDEGVFGAGLNVSYVNIEKLVADGAEGDDRYFVLSTGLGVITEIDGGLGSDTFFVGGNPSRAPIAVVSNDFKGHSGVVLHNVESTDAAWAGLHVEGLSANVGDDEEDFVLVTESGGGSRVLEGAPAGAGAGFAFDGYGLRLTRRPGAGQTVTINVVLAGMAPEDKAKGFRDLEFFAVNPADTLDGAPAGAALGYDPLTGLPNMPVLTFDEFNWDQPKFVKFRGGADAASEGRRFTFVNHTLQDSSDPGYQTAQSLSVKVQMDDDDRDGVIVTPSGRGNTVLEDGFTDTFDVVLARQPSHGVSVAMGVLNAQVGLSASTLNFTTANWNVPQTVTLTAASDAVLEGFHTDYIDFTVTSADVDQTVTLPDFIWIDGDFDALGVQDVPADKPTSYVLLPNRPIAATLQVKVAGNLLAAGRFALSGNTVTFLAPDGTPEFVSGKVEAQYAYAEEGYDGSLVKDSVVDVYDQDAPTVIIEQSDGSTDVIEGAVSGKTDTYRVRLSRAPSADVVVNADAVNTRATYGRTASFVEQVTVNGGSETALTFTPANWADWQTVTVGAKADGVFDGNDTQVFAPDLQTVNKIRGPLLIEGAAGAGSLSLPPPLMLPHELNVLEPDGNVVSFTPGSGGGARETMTVATADLDTVVLRLRQEDSNIESIFDLVGKTLEMSSGPGTGVVLDPARPNDRFDRFWLISQVVDLGGGQVQLALQNPTLVDPDQPHVIAPTAASKYAITSLSINFFADEREQVDYLFVFDEDSVADDQGALTSSDGVVLGFDPATHTLTADTAALQAVAKLAGVADIDALVNRGLDITVGPGAGGRWTIAGIADGAPGTKLLTLTPVTAGAGGAPTVRSEFRIDGGDAKGRVVGFGMGPNVLFSGRPQPGGITYGDLEVVQMSLGSGNDQVRVDYTTNAEDHTTERGGDFETLTLLDTGGGNDTVNVRLAAGDDGAFAINTRDGNDTVDAAPSTLGLTVFGWDGADTLTGGSGEDVLFGDRGRVDYLNADATIVTRLGHSVAPNPVNPPVTGASLTTLEDASASFPTEYGGLAGLVVQAISPAGRVQFRTIVSNTATTITVAEPWDATPNAGYFYRVSALPEDQTDGVARGPTVAWSIDTPVGGDDAVNGGGGRDLIVGGAGNDTVDAGAGADVVAGDNARFDFVRVSGNDGPTALDRVETTDRATDGADRLAGGDDDDVVIGGTGGDRADGGLGRDLIFGDNVLLANNPGSGAAVAPRFRTLTGPAIYDAAGTPLVGGAGVVLVPGGLPAWADWTITLDPTADNAGNDDLAGGAGDDHLFGQLGDDAIQGDGAMTIDARAARASVEDFAGPGADGDDYVEGNAGNDLILGNLGQDDLIGGSSDLFSYTTPPLRADGADVIFGGAGTDLARNHPGDDTAATGHARDADTILGDNGNLYRLVDAAGNYLAFTYDTYGTLKLVPRAVRHLDYAFGGNAATDIGGADLIHGESGDDSVYGTVGNDVLFGEGQDDDIYGGTGHDRIYGGAGEDGVVGDDGLIFTSRNGLTEALHGLNTASLQANLELPGQSTAAWINITGRLNKTVRLIAWEQGGNDVIYGGLGDDFLHAGAGNDAVGGAEALPAFYTDAPVTNPTPLVYDPATRKLAGYDANKPLVKVAGFLLNFDAGTAGAKVDDGKDRLFGDLGHDWIVGGTGKDRMFGGAGDDMLNADDNQDTSGGLNDRPDVPLFADADFVYGGDGLDVLIGNTGAERMFDWGGEFNTYVLPFNPFGEPTVSRKPSPGMVAFIQTLGTESGSDRSKVEPNGELGLFTHADPQWQANHGGPRDPQGPNAKAKRDTVGGPEDDRGTALPLARNTSPTVTDPTPTFAPAPAEPEPAAPAPAPPAPVPPTPVAPAPIPPAAPVPPAVPVPPGPVAPPPLVPPPPVVPPLLPPPPVVPPVAPPPPAVPPAVPPVPPQQPAPPPPAVPPVPPSQPAPPPPAVPSVPPSQPAPPPAVPPVAPTQPAPPMPATAPGMIGEVTSTSTGARLEASEEERRLIDELL